MKPHPRIRKTVKWCGLIATVALAMVWIRSGRLSLTSYNASHLILIELEEGQVSITRLLPESAEIVVAVSQFLSDYRVSYQWRWGFAFRSADIVCKWSVRIPVWIIAAPFVLSTALAWRLDHRARRRANLNHCPHCSYNLAGLPPSVPCPECGSRLAVRRTESK